MIWRLEKGGVVVLHRSHHLRLFALSPPMKEGMQSFASMDFKWPVSPEFPFEQVSRLGGGAFATVFLARHIDTKKDRAIKFIDLSSKKSPQKFIKSEIEIMERLRGERHPHLVRMHSVHMMDGFLPGEKILAMVLEYCDMGDLARYLSKKGKLFDEEAKKLFQDLVLGMRHLYENRIVHRDLKPQNLLLKKKGTETVLKLADFGLAKELEEETETMGSCVGTPYYIAPEIYTGHYDSKSDIWSAGAILYEMVTDKKVRSGGGHPMAEGDFVIPGESLGVLNQIYPGVSDLLVRSLKRYPKDRISWEDFFNHPWVDLRSRTNMEFCDADWSGEKSPYKFEKKIGEGATSHVYKATEKHTKKTVAIKVLQLRGGYAKSEFQIMQDLMQSRHPSIVRLFRIHEGERSKQLFFVMEYCDQGDLFQFLKKNGPISEDQTRELMGDLARGLLFLRSKNIVHRDIKPQNFLLKKKKNGRLCLKLADFGFSKQLKNFNQQFDSYVGTGPYVAPEKKVTRQLHSATSDLWSTGITMFQMLFNELPFLGRNHVEIEELHRTISIDFASKKGKVSNSCMHLLESLLQKDPKFRMSWDDFFAHPWLGLKLKDTGDGLSLAIQKVSRLKELAKRCNNDTLSFSLHMEALFIFEQLLPPGNPDGDSEESGEPVDSSRAGVSHGLRQPKTNPFKSDPNISSGSYTPPFKASSPPSSPSPLLSSFASDPLELEFRQLFKEVHTEASRLGQEINFRNTKIPSPLEIIYQQIGEIGRAAAQNESLGEDVTQEYAFCLSLLEILEGQVEEADQKLVQGLIERFTALTKKG